ncbi:Uncharacterized protein FKW44_016754 [Caligus rogercresseyi]|uniref:G-protein coupled receptors family 1 profile domain-containing protein n=1 Tax=Caligus rogercresseyi TaxID=217165 RepID=A0A7T8K0P4_CALRO|nr:Uncharacterized protein FKW44_016754 [Caligus rogercresseyi]
MLNSTDLNNSLSALIESIIHKWSGKEEAISKLSYGAILVVLEMTLTLLSIILNLVVIISIREKESLLNSTLNLLLGNLCFSNLLAAVFVKSIAIIYNGYAVTSEKWSVELAFCMVYTLSSRATWAVLPYTILVLSWLFVVNRATRILGFLFPTSKKKGDSPQSSTIDIELEILKASESEECSKDEEYQNEELEEEFNGIDGLGIIQKSILGFIWFVSLVYSLLSPQYSTRTPTRASFDISSSEDFHHTSNHLPHYSKLTYALMVILTLIFILEYPFNMFFYVIGNTHILLIPLFSILMRKDILQAALSVFSQNSVASQKEDDITFEQFQTHCGMGVNPT